MFLAIHSSSVFLTSTQHHSQYIKKKFAAHLTGLERKVLLAWRLLVYQQVRAKKMLLKHMMGGLRMVYHEWARYVQNTIKVSRHLEVDI